MGIIRMKTAPVPDATDETFIRARAYTIITTLDGCKQRLEQQRADAKAKWSKDLSDATKAYRELLRDEENHKASDKRRAALYDEVVEGVELRDKIAEDKAEDMKARGAKISKIIEADAEAKHAHKSADAAQAALFNDESKVAGMPWATDATLAVVYAALLDLDKRGAQLDKFQSALMIELAEADIEGEDLGLEASEAIEDDSDVAEFEGEDDEIDGDEELPFG